MKKILLEKSNVIDANRFCCWMVINSHKHNEDTIFNFKSFNFKPFKFNDKDKPSEFLIRFICKGIEYEYSYSLTQTKIITESLQNPI